MPDGSAVHPLAHTSEGRGLRSERVSADGISEQNVAGISVPDKLKLPAVGLGSGLGAGLTLSPEEAFGWGQGGLRTSELKPEDSASLRTGELQPSDMGGNITADLRLEGTPDSEGAVSPFWREMARQFGLGTRGVLEGLVRRPAPSETGSYFPPWPTLP